MNEAAASELREAWRDLIDNLEDARGIIDNPTGSAPQASNRVLAEGYRYLTGFIHHGIERAFHSDPEFPSFKNAISLFNKSTIDNADAIYFYAHIDGRNTYSIRGKIADCSHWRAEPRPEQGPYAPQYLIFEVADGPMSGDTGSLLELVPGFRTGFGSLDTSSLQVDDDGDFEVLLGPEKPEGYSGNFICTRKQPKKDDPKGDQRYATYVSGRQLFYDWKNEEPIHLSITNLSNIGSHPAALTAQKCAEDLRRMGSVINGQMRFWLDFYDRVLNVNGNQPDSESLRYAMPVNAYNKPNCASGDTGGGMSTNIYAGGIFELDEDEALLVEATFTGTPVYVSFHLGNLWGESPDYANHQSSMNLHQMYMGEDRVQRWVVAHRDPGVQNWLDTTGLPRGFLSHRWAYSELPEESEWPTIKAKKIRFDEIDACFPRDMPRLSAVERMAEIQVRQEHIQRRYRVF